MKPFKTPMDEVQPAGAWRARLRAAALKARDSLAVAIRAAVAPHAIALALVAGGGIALHRGIQILFGDGWALIELGVLCLITGAVIMRGLAK